MSKGNSEGSALTKFEVLGGGGNSGATLLLPHGPQACTDGLH